MELTITRTFNASKERLFKAWTDNDEMAKWSCPQGFTSTFGEADVRPGGKYRAGMMSPDGIEHIVQGVYREVIKPERLVMTHAWEDANGQPQDETLVTVTFAEIDGKTTMTFQQTSFKSAESRDSHHDGWSECFDKLDANLSL